MKQNHKVKMKEYYCALRYLIEEFRSIPNLIICTIRKIEMREILSGKFFLRIDNVVTLTGQYVQASPERKIPQTRS